MKLLTIDASTSQTGWALYDDGNLVEYGAIIPPKDMNDYVDKIELMADTLEILIDQFDVDKILLEEPAYMRVNINTSFKLRELFALIRKVGRDSLGKENFMTVNPKVWKSKMLTAKKSVDQKKECVGLVNELFKIKLSSNDIADAIMIGEYYKRYHNAI